MPRRSGRCPFRPRAWCTSICRRNASSPSRSPNVWLPLPPLLRKGRRGAKRASFKHPMTRPFTRLGKRPIRDGFIVVAVLWILGALAALASIYAIYVVDTAVAFGVHDDRLQAEALVSAGLELTAYQLTATPEARPTQGAFAFRLGRAAAAVEFRSEAARIDLNTAPKELLAGLFVALGVRSDAAEVYADRIVGWRTAAPEGQDPEASAYLTAGLRYPPRGAPFPHVGELWLVLGLPPALVERVLPFVTVYSGLQQINVADAAPEVL